MRNNNVLLEILRDRRVQHLIEQAMLLEKEHPTLSGKDIIQMLLSQYRQENTPPGYTQLCFENI